MAFSASSQLNVFINGNNLCDKNISLAMPHIKTNGHVKIIHPFYHLHIFSFPGNCSKYL